LIQPDEDTRLHESRLRSIWAQAWNADSLSAILDALYSHEINVGMQSFWDAGWTVWLGDEMNGSRTEREFDRDQFDLIPQWLKRTAEDLYPALKHGRLRSEYV
jgi:hypothetical protein